MLGRFFGYLTISLLASCSGSRESTRDTPVVALQAPSANTPSPVASASTESPESEERPIEAPATSAIVAMPAPSATVASGPPLAYPEQWIMRARGENSSRSCLELVYKNGCSQTRTGTVTFEVTIDDRGSVLKFTEVDNRIRNDKALVSQCLKKQLPNWTFHPPEGHEKTFRVTVALSDKC